MHIMGVGRLLQQCVVFAALVKVIIASNGHVNVELEILQFDNPTGTSYHGTDVHSSRKCCDVVSQTVNCPQQCDTNFVICLGGLSTRGCNGPMYNSPTPRLTDENSYTTSYDNRLVFTFTWNEWHSGPIDFVFDMMDYDTSRRQEIIDNFTLTTSLNVSSSYEQSTSQRFTLQNHASLDVSIRVWCQDGYVGNDCSQQCSPYDNFHVCNSHHTGELIPSCKDQDVLTIRKPPGSTDVNFNYTPAYIQKILFNFISGEICKNATSLDVNIVRFSLTRSIEFKATCDGTAVDNFLFTTHLYVMNLAKKTELQHYFPRLTVPTVTQKIASGSHMFMMLEVTSYHDSTNTCSGHSCSVQINMCTTHKQNSCNDYSMIQSTLHGHNLTICDGVVSSGTSNRYLIGTTSWPTISTDIKYNNKVVFSQHNKVIPATYHAGSMYDKASSYEMILPDNTHRLGIKFLIWCAQRYSGDKCQHNCQASGNHECNKDGHRVCKPGYHTSSCTDINECTNAPCRNGGTCQNTAGSFTCNCPSGRTGQTCEMDIDECAMYYCGSSATNCTNTPGSYNCTCISRGFEHNQCSDRNECQAHPCRNEGVCYNIYGSYNCKCKEGFTGRRCENDIDECQLQVCGNHITSCNNTSGGYNCTCLPGWTGSNCQNDINECTIKPCKYGTCNNTPGSYHCTCYPGATGNICEDIDECAPSHDICQHNGTCVNLPPPLKMRCDCPPGWDSKSHCIYIDRCKKIRPCVHGSCSNKEGSYNCDCDRGWIGRNCSTDVNECQQHIHVCHNNGVCQNNAGGYTCHCRSGWSGTNCTDDINECHTIQPCENNATCSNTLGGYQCKCASGWNGHNCTDDIKECNALFCQHGANCVNYSGDYKCNCPSGWTGDKCENDLDECSESPCENNGTCFNSLGRYHCTCLSSFTGVNCTLPSNEPTTETLPSNESTTQTLRYKESTTQTLPNNDSTKQTIPNNESTTQTFHKSESITQKVPNNESTTQTFHNNESIIQKVPNNESTIQTFHKNESITQKVPNNKSITQTLPKNQFTTQTLPNNKFTTQTLPNNASTTQALPYNKFTTKTLPNNKFTTQTLPNNKFTTQTLPNNEFITQTVANNEFTTQALPFTETSTKARFTDFTPKEITEGPTIGSSTSSAFKTLSTTPARTPTVSIENVLLDEAIHPACTGFSWNITVNMTILRETYPVITPNHVYFGDNSCQGIEKGSLLVFQYGFQDCLTTKRESGGTQFYENVLYYAIYDPINPFIIRQHKWTYTVECDVSNNEAASSHIHHGTNSGHATVLGHHQISLAFFKDPNFQMQIPGNPINANIGDDVYVKVFTNEPDWTTKMRLHTCFTKPTDNADASMTYYIIKDGCEVDSNTHIISQSTHETKFVFQDFEYSTNREGLNIYCNATFCESKDYSPGCVQSCTGLGGQALIGK